MERDAHQQQLAMLRQKRHCERIQLETMGQGKELLERRAHQQQLATLRQQRCCEKLQMDAMGQGKGELERAFDHEEQKQQTTARQRHQHGRESLEETAAQHASDATTHQTLCFSTTSK